MALNECFHFTKLDRAYGIRDRGLEVRLEDNSKAVGDTKPKISYSDTKIGAIGLFANFYEVYTGFKNGDRKPRESRPSEVEMYQAIMKSASFEDFLGDGMYLIFDGTELENTGGNTGKGGIYDASTTEPIGPEKLQVGLVRDNSTGSISYSKYDYIHYLMSTLTAEEYSQMIESMQERFDEYYKTHQAEIDRFKEGDFSKGKIDIADFCRVFKDEIDKSMPESERSAEDQDINKKPWELSKEDLAKFNQGAKGVVESLQNSEQDKSDKSRTDEQFQL